MSPLPYGELYPLVRSGGLFLAIVGSAIALGAAWFRFRNALLVVGAAAAAVVTTLCAAKLTAPYGAPTRAQLLWLAFAVLLEIVLMAVVVRRVARHGERARALTAFAIVGVHFAPMAPAFGPLVLALGAACVINTLVAFRVPTYGLRAVWGIDGSLKLLFGALMWSIPWPMHTYSGA